MAHETHEHPQTEKKSVISMRSSFWFVLILVGLFIAALNFINAMGHSEGHEAQSGAHATEHTATTGEAAHEEHATTEEHAGEAHHEEAAHEEAHH